jgi:flagellin
MTSGITSSSLFAVLGRNLNTALNQRSAAFERLSSGLRINKASDGAAELAVASGLQFSIDALGQAERNVGDFSSALQIADGALSQIQEYTSKLAELATQSGNGTLQDRSAITASYTEYTQEIQRIIDTTEFNGVKLLQGAQLSAQIGSEASSTLTVSTGDISAATSGLSSLDLSTAEGARAALTSIQAVSDDLSSRRGTLGSYQARLEEVASSISSQRLNEIGARSRIVDLDYIDGVLEKARTDILANANVALIAQASKLDKDRIQRLLG